jgi:hypothetical protein
MIEEALRRLKERERLLREVLPELRDRLTTTGAPPSGGKGARLPAAGKSDRRPHLRGILPSREGNFPRSLSLASKRLFREWQTDCCR